MCSCVLSRYVGIYMCVLFTGFGMSEVLLTHIQPAEKQEIESVGFILKNMEWKVLLVK